jgi:exodeoxyribonuclease V beta subunit
MSTTPLRVPRPPILQRIAGNRCLVIEAHAGTGKTYTIEHLVVDFLVNPAENYLLKEILIVTFTDKAARELRMRVRKMIEKILHSPEASCSETESHWVIDEAARTRLQLALFTFEEAQISTIHSFCQRVLRDTAFLSGGSLERTLSSTRTLFEKAFAELLREQFAYNEPYKTYLTAWLETSPLENLKTLLFEALSKNALKPALLKPVNLASTFEPESFTQGVRSFFEALVANRNSFPAHPRHGLRNLCGKFFLHHAKIHGSSGSDKYFASVAEFTKSELCFWQVKPPSLLPVLRFIRENQEPADTFVVGIGAKLEELHAKNPGEHDVIFPVLESHISFVRENFPSFSDIMLEAFLPELHARVEKLKDEQNIFDFEDLLTEVETSLRDNHNGVCDLLRERYKLALIDEFQDTDPVQWTIFKSIFANSEAHRLLVVGDPKQSIYRFRGADVQTYLEATSSLPKLELTRNFRSSQKIIDAYNTILSQHGTFFRNGGITYTTPVECGSPKAGILNSAGLPITHPLKLVHIPPPSSDGWKAEDYKQSLLKFITTEIRALTTTHVPLVTSQKQAEARPLRPNDIFVLTSSNAEATNVARVLRKSGVPCTTFQNGSVFDSSEAQEVACLMDAIAEPSHRALVARACLGPFFEWRLENMDALLANENGEPWLSLRRWNGMASREHLSRLFETILRETGLLRREIATNQSERTITNVLHILEVMQRWHTMENANFEECRQRLKQAISEGGVDAESENMQRLETDNEAVQILTMHKSKGLEAPVVFFYGGFGKQTSRPPMLIQNKNRDRIFDTREISRHEDIIEEQEQQETERLLYVALTRAGALLYLPFFEKKRNKDDAIVFELSLTGRYKPLAERLHSLAGKNHVAPSLPQERVTFASVAEIVECPTKVSNVPSHQNSPNASVPLPASFLATFTPPPEHSFSPEFFENLRFHHRAPGARSYTSLKKSGASPNRKHDEIDSPFTPLANSTPSHAETAEHISEENRDLSNSLPGGATFGVCFHEAMEKLELATVLAAPSCEEWAKDPTNSDFLTKILTSNGFSVSLLKAFAAMVFHSSLANCPLEDTPFPGLAHAPHELRETRFHMPWPEDHHIPSEGAFRVERGYLVGAIDAIFQWNEKFWVLDWKTDRLPAYNKTTCEDHMRKHYALQAQIYTLALARFLNAHTEADFNRLIGGYVYVFSRAPKPVAVAGNLSWQELVDFENRLKNAHGMNISEPEIS